ncbi:copper-binding protein [Piscinibacter sakaiensis]|uniref:Copper-binding protein n=1 Tax=Piscinibacter sakaiensis TaxID=1547922 RepID=A0A0K8P274_PISS1|nr:copper-binding protein [Piscinibacter sakaiensis]GAP36726.1 hypothetical protein ISF6_2566 [Piscinibacter sakaiensis]
MTRLACLCVAAGLLASAYLPSTALAQSSAHEPRSPATAGEPAPASGVALTEGEVRRIDREAGTVTLRHGEIRHLDMPGMTMVFQARPASLLAPLKVGDRLRFRAEKTADGYVVTAVEPLK